MSSSDSSAQWYVSRDGHQAGPMSRGEMANLYAEGKIAATDHVWSAEIAEWTPAASVLGPSPWKQPPPPPPAAFQTTQAERTAPASVTHTVVEGGSFKFSTFIYILLGLFLPLWPITLPLFFYLAYKSYNSPSTQTVRVIKS